jgi:hypothetical protein
MRSAFDRLKTEFPYQPHSALAQEVFIIGQVADDEDVIVNSASAIFGTFKGG